MFVDAAPDSIYGQLYDKFISPQRETAVCHSLQECLEWLFTDAKRVRMTITLIGLCHKSSRHFHAQRQFIPHKTKFQFLTVTKLVTHTHVFQRCRYNFSSPKVFFYYPETIFALDSIKCEVDMPWTTAFPGFLSMAVAKGNPHYELFQHFFLRYMLDAHMYVLTSTNVCVQIEVFMSKCSILPRKSQI